MCILKKEDSIDAVRSVQHEADPTHVLILCSAPASSSLFYQVLMAALKLPVSRFFVPSIRWKGAVIDMKKRISSLLLLGLLLSIPMSASADKTPLMESENDSIDDAWKAYLADLKPVVDVAEGCYYTVLVFDDGSVKIPGMPMDGSDYPRYDLNGWEDLIAVATTNNEDVYRLLGLRKDGTILYEDWDNSVDKWRSVIQISCNGSEIVGLCSDGKVLGSSRAYEYFDLQNEKWNDLMSVCAYDGGIIGIRKDGTVVQTYSYLDFSNWQDIVSLSVVSSDSGRGYAAGLSGRGTVSLSYEPDSWIAKNEQTVSRWRNVKEIAASQNHMLALNEDGCVIAVGENQYGECDVADWNCIISIAAGEKHSVALCEDGTVLAAGDNTYGQCNVAEWKNVTAIAANSRYTVGLLQDGTVVKTTGNSGKKENGDGNSYTEAMDVSEWRDIIAIDASGNCIVGLKKDGRVVREYAVENWKDITDITLGFANDSSCLIPDTEFGAFYAGVQQDGRVILTVQNMFDFKSRYLEWQDVVSVSASSAGPPDEYTLLLGLKADGSVMALGSNRFGQCEVSDWKDIVFITAQLGTAAIGVRADGTVAIAGQTEFAGEIEGWTDIKEISVHSGHVVGLRSDGTVVAAGRNDYGECEVEDWHDIVKVYAGCHHTLGIDRDGKLWYTGALYFGYMPFNLSE